MGIYLIEGRILGLPAFQGSPPLAELSAQHKAFIWNNKLAAVSLVFFYSLPAFGNRHTFSSAKQSNKTHTCAAAECPPPPCFWQSPATLNHSLPTPFSSLVFSPLEVKGDSLRATARDHRAVLVLERDKNDTCQSRPGVDEQGEDSVVPGFHRGSE